MKPQFVIALRYGLIGAIINIVALLVLYFIGKHPFLIPVVFDFRIFLSTVLIIFCLREIRDFVQTGILYFWQGMVYSYVLLTSLALLASTFVWIFAATNKSFIPSYIQKLLAQFTANKAVIVENVGIDAYNSQLQNLPLTSAADLAIDYFLKSMIIGLFLTIIFSVILRRQPKNQ